MSQTREMQAEALRTTTGILAARHRQQPQDAALLLEAYMSEAKARGIREQQAWFYLFGAAVHWGNTLAKEVAGERSVEVEDVFHELGTTAAVWPTS